MSSTAEQLKTYHNGSAADITTEAEAIAVAVTYDSDADSAEYDFADGSVLIVYGTDECTTYGSR